MSGTQPPHLRRNSSLRPMPQDSGTPPFLETGNTDKGIPVGIKAEHSEDEIEAIEEHDQSDTDIKPSSNTIVTNKAEHIIKPPRPVNAALKVFDTAHYELYNPWDPSRKHEGRKVPDNHKFTKFDPFDHYLLYMNPGNPTIEEIPFPGIRLDDRTVAIVLDGLRGRSSKSPDARCLLHACWPAEFDEQYMVRATRIPLGHAAKKLVQVGDIDLNGNFVQEGQQGYYYLWWGKIHCLMGKEGYDAGRYLIRPSHEDLHPNKARPSLGFK